MTDSPDAAQVQPRIFLVVLDESAELDVALRYASYRARNSRGRVALLFVTEPAELQHWMAVEDIMREERRAEAEQALQRHAKVVNELTGTMPVLYLREGDRREELLALIGEEPSISILVLGASTGQDGPGPLVTYLTGKGVAKLRIPLTIVPGGMSDEELKAVT